MLKIGMFTSDFWTKLSFISFFGILSLANVLMYVLTIAIIFILRRYFIQFNLNHQVQIASAHEKIQSLLVLLANILVGVLGFILLKLNVISLTNKSFLHSAIDFLILFCLIDFGMYFSHLLVHKTFLYNWLHRAHHAHESMSLISLYIMHPLEALGFGFILISALSVYSFDLQALLVFLFFNWILGVFAHSGIEPSQGQWGNYICMTRFHQIHHESHDANFGFFTPIMDTVFKTRKFKLKNDSIVK